MEIPEIISQESVLPNLKVTSKKQALHELSKRVGKLYGQEERKVRGERGREGAAD